MSSMPSHTASIYIPDPPVIMAILFFSKRRGRRLSTSLPYILEL
jgi:hypothetical protein